MDMALRTHLLHPNPFISHSPNPQTKQLHNRKPRFPKLRCTNDLDLSLDLATQVGKINTQRLQREEALKKSRELLFTEFCNYTGVKSDEMMRTWRKSSDEDKWVMVNGFVLQWASHFHPLSAKSVKELVDEYLVDNNAPESSFFPALKRLMGFHSEE